MKLIATLICFGFCLCARAQDINLAPFATKAISFGPQANLISKSIYRSGYGGSLKIEWPMAEVYGFTFTAGYQRMNFKADAAKAPAVFIPISLGSRLFLARRFYTDFNLGAAIETTYSKQVAIDYGFGFGYLAYFSKHSAVDIGFNYDRWARTLLRQSAVKLAYRFSW